MEPMLELQEFSEAQVLLVDSVVQLLSEPVPTELDMVVWEELMDPSLVEPWVTVLGLEEQAFLHTSNLKEQPTTTNSLRLLKDQISTVILFI